MTICYLFHWRGLLNGISYWSKCPHDYTHSGGGFFSFLLTYFFFYFTWHDLIVPLVDKMITNKIIV